MPYRKENGMRISSINNYYIQNNNIAKKNKMTAGQTFGVNRVPANAAKSITLTEKGKAVMAYIEQGCPRTEEGTAIFKKNFEPNFFDPIHNTLSITNILKKCEGNLDVINRTLGKYGLEASAELKPGSTIKNTRENLTETGYWATGGSLYDNFTNYIYHNRAGSLTELEERFGNYASIYMDNWEKIGVFRTFINSYNFIDDGLGDNKLYLEQVWKTSKDNLVRKI